jgi:hypothetical protein
MPEPDSTRPTAILSMPLLTEAPAEEEKEEEERAGRERRAF